MAGPYAGTLLADMGADVIKVESPSGGDYARALGPFAPGSADGAGFVRLDRNKRSVALDLKSAAGKTPVPPPGGGTDVILGNRRPRTPHVDGGSNSHRDPRAPPL